MSILIAYKKGDAIYMATDTRVIVDEEKRNELDEAHKAWLKEKEEVIKGLEDLLQLWNSEYTNSEIAYALSKSQEKIGRAIKFIEEAEM